MSKKVKNTRGMEDSILEESFHLGHSPEKWGPVPTEDYYQRAMMWLRLFWTSWRQMEPHVPAILERHPEMCVCDCSCMRHIGHPWGPLSLGPVLLGWTSPESPWLRRGKDGPAETCERACRASGAPAGPFRPVYEPWCHRGMSLMELAGHFLPHPPVVAQVFSGPAQEEAHALLAGLLPAVPGVVTGDPARVAAHLCISLEFHHAARLLTLAESDGLQTADVNAATEDDWVPLGSTGDTPLLYACGMDNAEIVRMLIDAGANVNAANSCGRTPLFSFHDDVDCARLLLAAGADVNARNSDGGTVLLQACRYGHVECARLFLSAGADVSVQDEWGCTALIYAASDKMEDIPRLLVDAGADVNAETKRGITALVLACRWGSPNCARLLIEAGANVNAKVHSGPFAGMTPLQAAGRKAWAPGHKECIRLLQAAGAVE